MVTGVEVSTPTCINRLPYAIQVDIEKRAQGTYLYVRDDILVRFVRRWAHAVVEGGKDKFLIAKHIADGSVVSIILQSSKR